MNGILDETPSPLEDDAAVSVDVLLARPHSPGNLGSAARACKAFGARLLLLDPRADAAHEDARAFASGAEDLLDSAPRLAGWEEVEEGARAVLALTSLRGRSARGLPPAWSWAAARRAARDGRLVLAFGPERSGLTTEEVRRASGRLAIPTRPEFPVLNLAQAVAASLALLAAGGFSPRHGTTTEVTPASAPALRRLREELAAALAASRYLGRDDDAVLLELLGPLLRSRPTSREADLWTGALRKLGHRVRGA
jgi:tRNA C32,U32 (ribose-2'-O)-methylase TrmJ